MKRVNEKLTNNARDLRNHATEAERLLWLRLRAYRPRFTRQLVVGPFIVDIACREAKLAIELDGSQHIGAAVYDQRRTEFLSGEGWAVLRLWNNEVIANPDGAAEHILLRCAERLGGTHPQPSVGTLGFVRGTKLSQHSSREGRIRRPRSRPAR